MEAENTSAKSPPVLVEGLHKSFGQQKVLAGLDLSVAPGETVGILGRSGTGKSVLLKLLVGLQQPDSGSIRIHGRDIAGLELEELNEIRKKIGFLFQEAALYDSLTVKDNIAFPLNRHLKLSSTEQEQRVQELLAKVGMERDLEKMPSELSGGMQRRVGLARALALDPDILLFDEPTAGLDPITSREIGELILSLKEERGLTAIVVTHDIQGVRTYSDRLVMVNEGHVVIEGTWQDLQRSQDQFVVQFLSGPSKEELCPTH
jgi:phospholipid/cholesterol/gamma-HCH transport system ATP-binding protein